MYLQSADSDSGSGLMVVAESLQSPVSISSVSQKGLDVSTYSDYGAKLMDLSCASSFPEESSELNSSRDDSLAGDLEGSQESIPESTIPDWLIVDSRVLVLPDSRAGTVRFVGSAEFASGIWVGIELDSPNGDSNGTVDGVEYFFCEQEFGCFVRMSLVIPNTNVEEDKITTTAPEIVSNGETMQMETGAGEKSDENVECQSENCQSKSNTGRSQSSQKRVPSFHKPTASSVAKQQYRK